MTEQNKATVCRLYDDILNGQRYEALSEILAEDVRFTGSFDIETTGIEAFREYAGMLRGTFPDLRVSVDSMVAEGDKVAVSLTYRGTHEGQLFEVAPTGRSIAYRGAAFFTLSGGKISQGWILGDVVGMLDQLLIDEAGEPEGEEEEDGWQEE